MNEQFVELLQEERIVGRLNGEARLEMLLAGGTNVSMRNKVVLDAAQAKLVIGGT